MFFYAVKDQIVLPHPDRRPRAGAWDLYERKPEVIVYIAVDDTDSRTGNCTTYLLTEIMRELSDTDIIGNPRLVRLNPAVPWKTRGNGSLVLRVGEGTGAKKRIGAINGTDIHCFPAATEREPDAAELIDRIEPVLKNNSSEG